MSQLSKAARSHRKYRDKEGGELSDGKRVRINEIRGKYEYIPVKHESLIDEIKELKECYISAEQELIEAEKKIELLEEELEEDIKSKLVYGFYEDEIPFFEQGPQRTELQQLLTAEEVNNMIDKIIAFRNALEETLDMLTGEIPKDNERIVKIQQWSVQNGLLGYVWGE